MKLKLMLLLGIQLVTATGFGQNTGIGTTTPQEKLDVNGAIKIGTTSLIGPNYLRL
jgi:hypothetical protein